MIRKLQVIAYIPLAIIFLCFAVAGLRFWLHRTKPVTYFAHNIAWTADGPSSLVVDARTVFSACTRYNLDKAIIWVSKQNHSCASVEEGGQIIESMKDKHTFVLSAAYLWKASADGKIAYFSSMEDAAQWVEMRPYREPK